MTLTVRNPATGEALAELEEATAKDVEAAVARVRAAQPAWEALGVEERARRMRAVQVALLEAREEVARTVTRETGKPVAEALGVDVLTSLDQLKWLAADGAKFLQGERIRFSNPLLQGRHSRIEYAPVGVVGIISPWNYPLALTCGPVAFSLLAGNTVVLKPASLAPLTALKLRELLTKGGVPEDVCIVVVGSGGDTGQALVDSDIDHMLFTGSVPVGRQVEARLRERGVSSCMELGGSDPALVLHDAVLDNAARGIVWARFTNAGQTCAAVKRCYVLESIHEAFVQRVVQLTKALRVGDPLHPDTEVGALTDPAAVAEMAAFVEDATTKGARVLCGGHARPDAGPHAFMPTVLVDVPAEARVLREETFGPILPIVKVQDEDEAVRLANASAFGLGASVWTRDIERGLAVARRIRAGTVVVNDAAYTFAATEAPWGGEKASGHGRTHGTWGLRDVTRMRHLNVVPPTHPLGSAWWFPYGQTWSTRSTKAPHSCMEEPATRRGWGSRSRASCGPGGSEAAHTSGCIPIINTEETEDTESGKKSCPAASVNSVSSVLMMGRKPVEGCQDLKHPPLASIAKAASR